MRVTAIRCPQCDATIDSAADASVTVCKYCGTTVHIEQTRAKPALDLASRKALIATYQASARSSSRWVAIPIIIGLAGAVLPFVLKHSHAISSSRLRWDGEPPHLVDIDGDGIKDIVGKVDRYDKTNSLYIGAYSGVDGHQLWLSPLLGSKLDNSIVVGDHVITSSVEGSIKGLALKTGAITWATPLGELVDSWCHGNDNSTVVVVTRDRKKHVVTIATGAVNDAPATAAENDSCAPLDGEQPTRNRMRDEVRKSRPNIDSLSVDAMLPQPDGTTIVAGEKKPGTAVPTVALLVDGAIKWQTAVDSVSPLDSSWISAEPVIGVNGDSVAAVYDSRQRKGKYITVFSLADGHRRWEAVLKPEPDFAVVKAVIGNGKTFVLASWTTLKVYDAATGAAKFTVGAF